MKTNEPAKDWAEDSGPIHFRGGGAGPAPSVKEGAGQESNLGTMYSAPAAGLEKTTDEVVARGFRCSTR
jgi:hypothetical protein